MNDLGGDHSGRDRGELDVKMNPCSACCPSADAHFLLCSDVYRKQSLDEAAHSKLVDYLE